MKKAAIIACVLALLCAGLLAYGLVNTRLQVVPAGVQAIPAQESLAEFERLRRAVENKSLIGTAYTAMVPGEASDYRLVVYTLQVENKGLIPAEMVELQVSPQDGDIACYALPDSLPDITVPPRGQATLRCVLLTSNQRDQNLRELHVTYYIWGNPFTVKITYG